MPQCALCQDENTTAYTVTPQTETVQLCATCTTALNQGPTDGPHWQCLNDAIWSPEPATQVLAWRLLKALPEAIWARDLLDIAYLEPEIMAWAEAGLNQPDAEAIIHRDAHGAVLTAGDSVTLIKDLPVKGAGFTAKRGTPVRNIALVHDNEDHIEGRIEGQRIVILCQYVKKN